MTYLHPSTPGEDVYDVGHVVWCDLCQAAHEDCETDEDIELRIRDSL